jgi:hypothetical protein
MARVKFNKNIYQLKAVKQAIEDYSSLAKFSLAEGDNYYCVNITGITREYKDILKDEFSNYVLVLTKNAS